MSGLSPKIDVSFAFGYYALSFPKTYTSVPTTHCREFTVARGRNEETQRFEAGTAAVTLTQGRVQDATHRHYDPFNLSSPYVGQLLPGNGMRITVGENPIPNPCGELPLGTKTLSTTGWTAFYSAGSGLTIDSVLNNGIIDDAATAPFRTYIRVSGTPSAGGSVLAYPVAGTNTGPCTPGETLTFSVYARSVGAGVTGIGGNARYYTSGNVLVSEVQFDGKSTNLTGWQRYIGTLVVPATAAKVGVEVAFNGANGVLLSGRFCGAQIVRGVEAQPFVSKPYIISTVEVEDWVPFENDYNEWDWVARPFGTDALSSLAEAQFSATFADESSDTRITNVLAAGAIAYAQSYVFSAGESVIQGATFDRASVRGHVDEVVDTEMGVFFCRADGSLVFLSRADRNPQGSGTGPALQVYLSDYPADTLSYGNGPFPLAEPYTYEYSNRRVKNDLYGQLANDPDAVVFHFTDSTSCNKYRFKTANWNPILAPGSEGEVEDGLYWRLLKWANWTSSVNKIVIEPSADDRSWERLLPIDIGSQIELVLHFGIFSGGSSQYYWVEAVRHTMGPNKRYKIEFSVSLTDLPNYDYMILGDATYGQLDNVRVGY